MTKTPPAPPPPPEPENPFVPEPPKRSSRLPVVILTALLVVTVVALGVVTAQLLGLRAEPVNPSSNQQQPVQVTNEAITVGSASAKVTVDLYVDYMCPYCGAFDRMNGPDLAARVADGTILLRLHPMSFLDQASGGTAYSTRAANAVVTVAKFAPAQLMAFHMKMFELQPMEGTPGLTDAQIVDAATEVGVPADVSARFASLAEQAWVAAATEADFKAVTGTPTVMVNGAKLGGNLYQPGVITQALAQVGQSPAPSSPSPSPSS